MEKPVVFPKWATQVQVSGLWHTTVYSIPVPALMGISQVYYI
jgi:hypothetical protein